MTLPFDRHFEAHLPLVASAVRITSLYDAQVFMRRWVIRDKDRNLKALLRTLERANSGARIAGDGRIQADAGGARSFAKASRLNAASSIRGGALDKASAVKHRHRWPGAEASVA